jgi:hypothetical protein
MGFRRGFRRHAKAQTQRTGPSEALFDLICADLILKPLNHF